MQTRHAIERSNGVSWKSEPMVHPGIFLLHFVLFEVMLLPDYINLSQNWSKGISAERNYRWGQKETCFLFFVCHFPCEQLIGRSLDLNLLLCPLKAVIHLQVSSGRLDLGRSFCFSAGGHVRIACCRVNHARKLIEC